MEAMAITSLSAHLAALDIVHKPLAGFGIPSVGPLKPIDKGFTLFFKALLMAPVVAQHFNTNQATKIAGPPDIVSSAAITNDPIVADSSTKDLGQVDAVTACGSIDTSDSPADVANDNNPTPQFFADTLLVTSTEVTEKAIEVEIATVAEIVASLEDNTGLPLDDILVTASGPVAADAELPDESVEELKVSHITDDEVVGETTQKTATIENEVALPVAEDMAPEKAAQDLPVDEDVILPTEDLEKSTIGEVMECTPALDVTITPEVEDDSTTSDDNEVSSASLLDAVDGQDGHQNTKSAVTSEKEVDGRVTAETSIMVPVFPIVYEDEFDASVATLFDSNFERFVDIDGAWAVPQLAEKAKSERNLVKERLAERAITRSDLQNLRLAKASRALTPNGFVATPRTVPPTAVRTSENEKPTLADGDKLQQESSEQSSDSEDVVAGPAKGAPSGPHSRSSSSSSAGSNSITNETSVGSAPCPGTPATQYSITEKAESSAQNDQEEPTPEDIATTLPVPGEEQWEYQLVYAVLNNGEVRWFWPKSGYLEPLSDEELEEFYAIYPPDGGLEAADETFSVASSEFVLDPDEADLFDDGNTRPIVNLPRPETPAPPSSPASSPLYDVSGEQDTPVAYPPASFEPFTSADLPLSNPSRPSSPHRRRATPLSWTGLEETEWGHSSFIDVETGLLAVWKEREVQEGVSAGALRRADYWVGWEDRALAPPVPDSAPGLRLVTDEGQEYWLDDAQEYHYEYYAEDGFFDHRCAGQCEWCYNLQRSMYDQAAEDVGGPDVDGYGFGAGGAHFAADDHYGDDEDDKPADLQALNSLCDRIEATVRAQADTGSREELPPALQALAPVLAEPAEVARSATPPVSVVPAAPSELPLWVRDPTYISNKNWADLEEEDEY
ncbi:hypothetical protein VTK26DRAFT_8935 [Humicola hyalothermophila]